MKTIILLISLTLGASALASPLKLDKNENQEKLVLQDLEQIQNHGKRWHSKLRKATTTTATGSITARPAQHEG